MLAAFYIQNSNHMKIAVHTNHLGQILYKNLDHSKQTMFSEKWEQIFCVNQLLSPAKAQPGKQNNKNAVANVVKKNGAFVSSTKLRISWEADT